jgi:hypothetical protein
MPCLCRCACSQVQSVTRFLSEHMFPMRSASEILNLHITAATCGRPVMPSASGCSNMCRALSVCRWSTANTITNAAHLHTVACCLIVLASCQCGCSFLTAAHEPRPQGTSLPMLHYMNSTRHAAHRHTHKHMPACMLMCYCSRFRATQMSQRYARVPFLLCKFHAHACSNPGRLCQRYAPVLYLLCIFHTWLRHW